MPLVLMHGELAVVLVPGGRFPFTAAHVEGTQAGRMNGVAFCYVSLGAARYRALLVRQDAEHQEELSS